MIWGKKNLFRINFDDTYFKTYKSNQQLLKLGACFLPDGSNNEIASLGYFFPNVSTLNFLL